MHKKLLIFDIETVPDIEAGRRLLHIDDAVSDEDALLQFKQYHLDITNGNNDFIRQPFHKIVAISFAECDIDYLSDGTETYYLNEIRSGGAIDATEAELVSGFFAKFAKLKPRLVSYNGKYFDLPVLKYRAMLHKVQARTLFKSGDKWNSYQARYAQEWHCDLLDAFSDYGASARVKMSEVSALLGIPSKTSVDGSMVADLYDQGKIADIRKYCEEDVAGTYAQYLHYQYLNGTLSKDAFEYCHGDLTKYLDEDDKVLNG